MMKIATCFVSNITLVIFAVKKIKKTNYNNNKKAILLHDSEPITQFNSAD